MGNLSDKGQNDAGAPPCTFVQRHGMEPGEGPSIREADRP